MNPKDERNDTRYVIISPVRDEGQYIEQTIQSVAGQTTKPLEWVIVDDGSSDDTGTIVDRYAKQYPWISPLHRPNRGFRNSGGGVMEAFDDGYQSLISRDWEFIVKLDGDLSLEPHYFEKCFGKFRKDPRLGIGGGIVYHTENGAVVVESNPLFHVRGATKIYRRACWDSVGGLLNAPGWDTIDEAKANMLGWHTRSFTDLRVLHRRPTGACDGPWQNSVKNGRANYVSGYHPLFMLIKCCRRVAEKPYLISAIGLLHGFLSGYIERTPQVQDQDLIRYIRRQQLRRLLLLESIWK